MTAEEKILRVLALLLALASLAGMVIAASEGAHAASFMAAVCACAGLCCFFSPMPGERE